jgi:hypothetical protein
MAFNVAKCKIMHLGHDNLGHTYTMNGQQLGKRDEERDIGVTVTRSLKPTAQCMKAARTASTVLGQISRALHFRDRHVFIRLHIQCMRPHLEFAAPA